MVRISISDALRCGFDLLRREWRAVLVWSGLWLVASLAAYGVLMGEWATFSRPDITAAEVARLEEKALGWNLLSIALSQVATVLIICAVMRALLHPQDRGFFYLRLSARELWVALASLAAAGLALVPLLPAAALGLTAFGAARDSGLTPLVLGALLSALAGTVAAAWIALRLIALLPLAFEQKRVPLKAAWRLTRGHVGRILLLMLAIFAIMLAVSLAVFVVMTVVGLAVGGSMAGLAGGAFGSESLPAVTAVGIVVMVLGAGYTGTVYAVANGAWVDLYRQLTVASDEASVETA